MVTAGSTSASPQPQSPKPALGGYVQRALNWWFRNRRNGRITVVQWPNVSLTLYLVATVVDRIAQPSGRAATVIGAVSSGALVWWSGDELARGVNPWRRLLGAVVLTGLAVGALLR